MSRTRVRVGWFSAPAGRLPGCLLLLVLVVAIGALGVLLWLARYIT